ncbi:MAG: hypothetical protein QOD13_32 [Thermoleophilaceae bacterium]|nr:hypothetical protein [Thermoleophilaceae bacterium]
MSVQAPKVFISYRREETAGHAGRLYDAMASQFGEPNVFMDVEMAPGIDFVERITEVVGGCHVLLVVMGPSWATLQGAEGRARLAESRDFVRLEVETALERSDVTVIPLLVAGAHMPEPEQLPERLHGITRRNALELSDGRWRYDVGRLENTLAQLLGVRATEPEEISVPEPESRPAIQTMVEALAVAALAGLVGGWLSRTVHVPQAADDAEQITRTLLQRALTWTLAGVALAAWLTVRRGDRRLAVARAGGGLVVGALAGVVGGAIYSAGVYGADATGDTVRQLQIAAVAAIGAVLGLFVGRLWRPAHAAAGLIAGAAGGTLAQAILSGRVNPDHAFANVLAVVLRSALIVGLVVGTMLALDALDETPAASDPPSAA